MGETHKAGLDVMNERRGKVVKRQGTNSPRYRETKEGKGCGGYRYALTCHEDWAAAVECTSDLLGAEEKGARSGTLMTK
jgi:hypothetical protein